MKVSNQVKNMLPKGSIVSKMWRILREPREGKQGGPIYNTRVVYTIGVEGDPGYKPKDEWDALKKEIGECLNE